MPTLTDARKWVTAGAQDDRHDDDDDDDSGDDDGSGGAQCGAVPRSVAAAYGALGANLIPPP